MSARLVWPDYTTTVLGKTRNLKTKLVCLCNLQICKFNFPALFFWRAIFTANREYRYSKDICLKIEQKGGSSLYHGAKVVFERIIGI